MRYFGSVAFFRHLIILALLLMAVLSGKYIIDVFIRKEPSEIKKERVSDLQYDEKSLSESDGKPQTRPPSFSYQSAYSELYGAAGQERALQAVSYTHLVEIALRDKIIGGKISFRYRGEGAEVLQFIGLGLVKLCGPSLRLSPKTASVTDMVIRRKRRDPKR